MVRLFCVGKRRSVICYVCAFAIAVYTCSYIVLESDTDANHEKHVDNSRRRIQSVVRSTYPYRYHDIESLEHPPSDILTSNHEENDQTKNIPCGRNVSDAEKVIHTRIHFPPPKNEQIVEKPKPMSSKSKTDMKGVDQPEKEGKKPPPQVLVLPDKRLMAKPNKLERPPPPLGVPHRVNIHGVQDLKQPQHISSFLPKHYARDKKALQRYMDYIHKVESPLPVQDKAVIILTNHRSGSSFFGELFNQHPDAFYMFEPLFPLGNSSDCVMNADLKVEILKKLVQCELPNWVEVYKGMPLKNKWLPTNGNMRYCMRKRMCFRMNTKEVCEDRHCPRGNLSRPLNCNFDCGAINPQLVNNDCRRKTLVALKLIRFCDILDLEDVIKSTATDIKVLHLLRDPRGIANSRLHITRKINIKESIYGTCKRQSHNMISGLSNTPDWLKGRYMVLRYEDTALFPYETAQSVYNFVGLSFPDEIKEWIAKNTDIEKPMDISSTQPAEVEEVTHGITDLRRHKRDLNEVAMKNKEHQQQKLPLKPKKKTFNPYGTKRNSTATVQKWITRLPYSTVKVIETVCVDAMKRAGYKSIGTPEQYSVKEGAKYFTDNIEILKHSV